jgi:predicted RNase H-like HicB family nuclease
MKLYKLPTTVEEPSEDSGGKYVAEVPMLPGCRAWGDSAAEAVDHLQSVAAAFIESYQERGDELPDAAQNLASESGASTVSEVLIAV